MNANNFISSNFGMAKAFGRALANDLKNSHLIINTININTLREEHSMCVCLSELIQRSVYLVSVRAVGAFTAPQNVFREYYNKHWEWYLNTKTNPPIKYWHNEAFAL